MALITIQFVIRVVDPVRSGTFSGSGTNSSGSGKSMNERVDKLKYYFYFHAFGFLTVGQYR